MATTDAPSHRAPPLAARWAPLTLLLAAALAAAAAGCGKDATGSQQLASRCAAPRSGVNPANGKAYPDAKGSVSDEKAWVRAWMGELYLWYREIPDADPAASATPLDYFEALKTKARTSSGKLKDAFSFTLPTATYQAQAQSGVEASYGIRWVLLASRPPREIAVALVEARSPAASANIGRGARITGVDGVPVVDGDAAALNAGLFPAGAGETHTLEVLDLGATATRPVTLTSANVTTVPVQSVKTISPPTGGPVGYFLFNDHIATAETLLLEAISQLKADGVTDLVLDIRYNGGGFLDIASELAFMIAGPAAANGKVFERLVFNDRTPGKNPVTGDDLVPTPFQSRALGFSAVRGTPLPVLALPRPRVFVLTGPGTCSASESVINGLRGAGVQVIQIGSTTCGKPYGFYPADNCGTTYFAIQFQGVNALGFGDYADGFTPGGSDPAGLPGCQVGDDFGHALGDPAEARLAAALAYRDTGTCPAPSLARAPGASRAATDGEVVRPVWLQNRIIGR